MTTILDLAREYAQALEKLDAAAQKRLVDAFALIVERLGGRIDALGLELASGDFTANDVYKLERYRLLMQQIARELQDYQGFLSVELQTYARTAIEMAAAHAGALAAQAMIDAGVVAMLERIPTPAIIALLGFLDPAGPLYARLGLYGAENATRISDLIIEHIALGYNPRAWARLISEQGLGMPLTDALRMARTVQLYAYREATRVNYLANSRVVRGWVWLAALDDRVCLSCVAMHGTEHGLDETLNDHHNGRCAMIPLVSENPITTTGEAWFDSLSDTEQQRRMGPGKYAAFRRGDFLFSELSAIHSDLVYGDMRVEATLKSLSGTP